MQSLLSNRLKFCLIVTILALSLAGCDSGNNRLLEESFDQLYTVEPSANIIIQNGDGAAQRAAIWKMLRTRLGVTLQQYLGRYERSGASR